MKKRVTVLCAAIALMACGTFAMADVIAGWNFNDSNLTSDTGAVVGLADYVGGTTLSGWNSGASGQAGDIGWNTTTYPAQDTNPKTAGTKFTVSTVGYADISVVMDMRHSNTSANKVWFQYTTDGTSWTDAVSFTADNGDKWFPGRSFSFAGITAVENNASFAVRAVTDFNPDHYMPSTPTKTYATSGTLRFDNVTISGTAVPEPGSLLALFTGLVGFVGVVRRRK